MVAESTHGPLRSPRQPQTKTAPGRDGNPDRGPDRSGRRPFPMAEPQSNARLRADAGAPTSGVIHVRTRLTADFTVLANALVQRPGSAVTVGVAAYILSLPDGARVSIAALCAHFTEGEILISRALRELESAGYLERRRERGPGGLIRTRTYVYDVPPETAQEARPGTSSTADTRRAASVRIPQTPHPGSGTGPRPVPVRAPRAVPAPPPPLALPEADPQAVVILASLRIADRRLILSRREVAELAPAVAQWLAQGVGPGRITDLLTTGLPDHFRTRPARILAFRLRELPVPAPPIPVTAPPQPAVLPWQTCDGGCERAFRAANPGCCRDCRPESRPAHGPADSPDDWREQAC